MVDSERRITAPSREVHRSFHFPEPRLVDNEIFSEVRYSMAPSVVRWLDFEDIRDGIIRIFAVPLFEGDVRVFTLADEEAVACVLSGRALNGVRRKRLLALLHAAAAAPAAALWPATRDEALRRGAAVESASAAQGPDVGGGLYPHQLATVAWMEKIENASGPNGRSEVVTVRPIDFAGVLLGSEYDVALPRGGVVAHPPGSGKTRIIASMVAKQSQDDAPRLAQATPQPGNNASGGAKTLVVCPAHLRTQWSDELARCSEAGAAATILADFAGAPEAVGRSLGSEALREKGRPWERIVIDEPQDCPEGDVWKSLVVLCDQFRAAGAATWLLCGTAQSHMDTIGRLLLGRSGWHIARVQSEWRGCPQLSHLIRARFVADPPWACLPMPALEIVEVPVVLRHRESADAAIAGLAGFVLDGLLLLSFGAEAAFAAAQERDALLTQMGWLGSVGTSLLPAAEHALSDWEGIVEQRSRQKLDEIAQEIANLEAEEGKYAARYLFSGGDAAFAPDLHFLSRDAVRVEATNLGDAGTCSEVAGTAEWNDAFAGRAIEGPIAMPSSDGFAGIPRACVVLIPEPSDGDFASLACKAHDAGACAVLFETLKSGGPRPFGYRDDQTAPRVPAAMVSHAFAVKVKDALAAGACPAAVVMIAGKSANEEEEDVDQGLVSAFIAEDAIDEGLQRQLKALRDERERCDRALRFAKQMRTLLEDNEAHCPICFRSGAEVDTYAVMPDCFHLLCRTCLDQQVGFEPSFACPMCRVNVARLDVTVFRAPAPTASGGDGDGGGQVNGERELISQDVAEARSATQDNAPRVPPEGQARNGERQSDAIVPVVEAAHQPEAPRAEALVQ